MLKGNVYARHPTMDRQPTREHRSRHHLAAACSRDLAATPGCTRLNKCEGGKHTPTREDGNE